MKDSLPLRKLGFFTGLWWVSLKDRDEWLGEWVEAPEARVRLFLTRTATFVVAAWLLAQILTFTGDDLSLNGLFLLAAAFGAVTLWWRSETWITEYRDIFSGTYDQ